MAAKTRLILVGGFLGAGKTTLLARSAEALARRGLDVALITNDQASQLVDTQVLTRTGQRVEEVAGACFCCAFNQFIDTCRRIIDQSHPAVILGEPVGSCTDLSATVLQPIKKLCFDWLDLLSFTVLVDPAQAAQVLSRQATQPPDPVDYIYLQQLREADQIGINKTDTLGEGELAALRAKLAQAAPGVEALDLSAATGGGVDAWLDRELSSASAGVRIASVDYATYARGEAMLGWLNAHVHLRARTPVDWQAVLADLLAGVADSLAGQGIVISHLKANLTCPAGWAQGNVIDDARPSCKGELAGTSDTASVVINARARCEPATLREIILSALREASSAGVLAEVDELKAFQPAPPVPVHRMNQVVEKVHT